MRHLYLSSRAWHLAGGTREMSQNIIAGKYGLGSPSQKPLVTPMVFRLTQKVGSLCRGIPALKKAIG